MRGVLIEVQQKRLGLARVFVKKAKKSKRKTILCIAIRENMFYNFLIKKGKTGETR